MNPVIRAVVITTFLMLGITTTTLAQASYAPAPSWSPMTMMNVSFDITAQRLSVVDQAELLGVGVNAPLAVNVFTAPGTTYGRPDLAATTWASFDPTKPWAVLNDTAFSRRLGWSPGGATRADRPAAAAALQDGVESVYGTGASIWIDCILKSQGLEAYLAVGQWGVNAADTLDPDNVAIIDPAANGYTGIFGTAGSSTKWEWDYLMDHNTYAVSSAYLIEPNQPFWAQYKVYIGDAQGNEIMNQDGSSASTIETWTWQGPANLPEPATLTLLAAGTALLAARKRKA